ncbi:MAG: PadR family transcriptional regulator [Gemmatimonadaceae bacterium]|nr:PadR family transcriptional regulator [Gemmatimonadaceae bacterium]
MPTITRRAAGNRSRYAILGALALGPKSGYDLRSFFERNLGFFWQESYGQIYPMLRALAGERLIEAQEAAAGTRRRPYAITRKGRAALARWLDEPAAMDVGRVEVLLKLFFARNGSPDALATHLAQFRAEHEQRLRLYSAVEARFADELAHFPEVRYWRAAMRYGVHLSQAMLAWCEETTRALSPVLVPTTVETPRPARRPRR